MKKYKGLTETGKWENFTCDNEEEAKPENSGYEKVIREDGLEIL